MRKKQAEGTFGSYNLLKTADGKLSLKNQNDSPFAYHLHTKKLLRDALSESRIERYHFNIFRALLEKTANFLGYTDWTQCIDEENREAFVKLLHTYSHGRLSDMEPNDLPAQDIDVFDRVFNRFVVEYKWSS